jgi:hypothetical protein
MELAVLTSSLVGWTDPEGARSRLGGAVARLQRSVRSPSLSRTRRDRYRPCKALSAFWRCLQPLVTPGMPLKFCRHGKAASPLILRSDGDKGAYRFELLGRRLSRGIVQISIKIVATQPCLQRPAYPGDCFKIRVAPRANSSFAFSTASSQRSIFLA